MTRLLEPIEISQNNVDKEFVEKVISIIENEMTNNQFNVKILASKMAMSPSTFLRKTKGITGLTCDQFIRSIRLKRAANLLSNTKTPVKEISFIVGFSSQKHFSTTFKKSFECLQLLITKNISKQIKKVLKKPIAKYLKLVIRTILNLQT